jgi:hypothetical protein
MLINEQESAAWCNFFNEKIWCLKNMKNSKNQQDGAGCVNEHISINYNYI